jgi:hypothetical protein
MFLIITTAELFMPVWELASRYEGGKDATEEDDNKRTKT